MTLGLPNISTYPLPDTTSDIYVPVRRCNENGTTTNTILADVLGSLQNAGHAAETIQSVRTLFRTYGHATIPSTPNSAKGQPAQWIENTLKPDGWAGELADEDGTTGDHT